MRRRWCEHESGVFLWREIFVGSMLDVGSGDDPLPFDNVTPFDQAQGDANKLSSYFPSTKFDLVHASQVLEHMRDPLACLADWLTLVKSGGHLCITVPEAVLYGDMFWDDKKFNGDHKSTWSMWIKDSVAPIHIYIPQFVSEIEKASGARSILSRVVDTNYDYRKLLSRVDQTFDEKQMVEAFDEIVFQKQ